MVLLDYFMIASNLTGVLKGISYRKFVSKINDYKLEWSDKCGEVELSFDKC